MIRSIATLASSFARLAEAVFVFATNCGFMQREMVGYSVGLERTVTVSIVSRDFFTDWNWSEYSERDILPFAKELAIVVAVMLQMSSVECGPTEMFE